MTEAKAERVARAVHISVVTVSDTRTEATDKSGNCLVELIKSAGHTLVQKQIVKDDPQQLEQTLRTLIQSESEVILTTGGTGLTGRDITPEVVLKLADKEIPGFGELFRWQSYQKIGTSTLLSRALGVISEGVYIFALPGSPSAVKDAWNGILVEQLDQNHRPCNLIEVLPRLQEGFA